MAVQTSYFAVLTIYRENIIATKTVAIVLRREIRHGRKA